MKNQMKYTDIAQLLASGHFGRAGLQPHTHDLIQSALPGFDDLCHLPSEEREKWCTDLEDARKDGFDADRGLIFRKGAKHDKKAIFQYRESLLDELRTNRALMGGARSEFLLYCHYLWQIGYDVALDLCRALDEVVPGHFFHQRVRQVPDMQVLRLLRYTPGGEFFAMPHCDLGFLTLAMYDGFASGEPFPALSVNGSDPLVSEPNIAHAFLGTKAPIITDESLPSYKSALEPGWVGKNAKLKAHYHFAQNRELQQPRYAVIFFTHIDVGLNLEEMSLIQKQLTRYYEMINN